MAIAHTQSTGVQFGNSASARTLAYASNVAAGSLLAVGVVCFNSGTLTVAITDTLGNTYSQAGGYITSGNYRLSIWYCISASGGANTVTVTPSATAFLTFSISEYSGVKSSSPLDGTNGGSAGSGTTASTGTITVSEAGELIYAIFTSGVGVKTVGSGYNERYNAVTGANNGQLTEDKFPVGSNEAATCTVPGGFWVACGASFKVQPSYIDMLPIINAANYAGAL